MVKGLQTAKCAGPGRSVFPLCPLSLNAAWFHPLQLAALLLAATILFTPEKKKGKSVKILSRFHRSRSPFLLSFSNMKFNFPTVISQESSKLDLLFAVWVFFFLFFSSPPSPSVSDFFILQSNRSAIKSVRGEIRLLIIDECVVINHNG